MNKKILAIITARGGSKGIPGKNLKILNGKPLIYYTINEAKKSKYLSRICLSTDSDEIISYCNKMGLDEQYKRPANLSLDDTPSLPVVQDYVKWLEKTEGYKPDYILLLQPTSPLRIVNDIDNSIIKIINSNADSLVSVVEAPHQFIPESIMKIEGDYLDPFIKKDPKTNRQQKPKYYARNGAAIYITTYDCLMNKNSLYGDKILPYIMPKESSVDIDDYFDFELCEYLLKKREKL